MCIFDWIGTSTLIEDHQGLAAWVQAIFSIAAIWYAGVLARKQLSNEQLLQRDAMRSADDQLKMGARAIADIAETPMFFVLECLRDREFVELTYSPRPMSILKSVENALTAIPVHVAGNAMFAYWVISLKITVSETISYLEQGQSGDTAFFNQDEPLYADAIAQALIATRQAIDGIHEITQDAFERLQ